MRFVHPFLLLTLVTVPVVLATHAAVQRRRARYAVRFTNVDVLATVAGSRRAWRRAVPLGFFVAALTALCIGVARPQARTMVVTDKAMVILVLDQSGSMFAQDVRPTRLAAAQAAVRTFLDKAPKRIRVGLIVFAGEPQVATPPTSDHQLVRQSVDALGTFPEAPGTAIGDALAAATQLAQTTLADGSTASPEGSTTAAPGASGKGASSAPPPVSVLFLSDGSQTRGLLQPLEGAARAKSAKIPVYTIALGTPEGTITRYFGGFERTIPVPPDPQTLSAIAEETGGKFFDARSATAVRSAYAHLGTTLGRVPGHTEVTYAFLAFAAAALVASGVLSALWSPRLP